MRLGLVKNSLASRLQLVVLFFVMIVFGAGLSVLLFSSYRISKNERSKTVFSVGSGLTRLIARPISLGDFISLEDTISGARVPDFVCGIKVRDRAGRIIAGAVNSDTSGKPCVGNESVEFEISNIPEMKDGFTKESLGAVTLEVDNSDLTSRFINTFLFSGVVGCGLLLLLGFLSRIAIRRTLTPLAKALDSAVSDQNSGPAVMAMAPDEVKPLFEKLNALHESQARYETNVKIGKVAAQVAHDIRSPLAALNIAIGDGKPLTEEKRVLARSAISRINDISNNLLAQYRSEKENSNSSQRSTQLLTAVVESLISEKRLQYRDLLNVEIDYQLARGSYGLFSNIQSLEFKRVLSNLINNAVEALPNKTGLVTVSLSGDANTVVLEVSDNGKGIAPEILPQLAREGKSFGKNGEGSGLGLHHARTTFEAWGGSIDIKSELGKGTTVFARLPRAAAPKWFIENLELPVGSQVIIADDDSSIHQIWKGRLESSRRSDIEVLHFSTPKSLKDWFATSGSHQPRVFLLDYEFLGDKETGLDLIKELDIASSSILVTNRYEESNIFQRAIKMGVRMIPKGIAGLVPVTN